MTDAEGRLRLIRAWMADPFATIPGLEPRERHLAALVAHGLGAKEAAKQSAVGWRTVYRELGHASEVVGRHLGTTPPYRPEDLPLWAYMMLQRIMEGG